MKNRGILIGVLEATRLTRAGRLLEATALIQRILPHSSAATESAERHASGRDGGANDDVIDVEFSAVAEPADRDLTPLQGAPGDDLSQRFGLERFLRGRRDRDSVADVRPHRGRWLTGNRDSSSPELMPIKPGHAPTSSISRRPTRDNRSPLL